MRTLVIALVDESILLSGSGCYLLACVVIPLDRKAPVRRELRRLTPSGHRQFHWKGEEERERGASLRLLGAEATHLFAFVGRPVVRREHEHTRARLLRMLLDDLGSTDVIDLLIESRQPHNDARDRHVIAQAQGAGITRFDLNYGHSDPVREPLLWLADALAGATMAQVRKDGQYIAALPTDRLVIRPLPL